ncbi:MAG: hypothetical protein ACI4F4_07890 [Lachnospiraceae bacterium]
MNAQQIYKIINEINPGVFEIQKGMLDKNKKLLDEIYKLASLIEPWDKYRNGIDRKLWLWTDKGSFEEYAEAFKDHFTYRDEPDYQKMKARWTVDFPDDTVWFNLYLAEHEGNRGLFLDGCCIVDTRVYFASRDRIDMESFLSWILESERKCIEMIKQDTYSNYVSNYLPYIHRSGVVKMSTYWKYVPEDKERIFGRIDPVELDSFLHWDQDKDIGWESMTKNEYFQICNDLYDLLNLKEKYPIRKKDAQDETMTPKDYYLAYAAATHYDSAHSFLELEEDSAEAFDDFVENGYTEHHTWEVCLSPNIHLFPEKRNGKIFISVLCSVDEYDLLIHLCLELRKKGYPIIKPIEVEERMSGEQLVAIVPSGDNFNWQYAWEIGVKTSENRSLPKGDCEELIKEISWFPVGEWKMKYYPES